MEIIWVILAIIVGIYLLFKIEDKILIFTAGLVGSNSIIKIITFHSIKIQLRQ